MVFNVKDLETDVLCITVFDRDYFSPNGLYFCFTWRKIQQISANNMSRFLGLKFRSISMTLKFYTVLYD